MTATFLIDLMQLASALKCWQ